MTADPARDRRVMAVVSQLLRLKPEERDRCVSFAAGGDQSLHQEILSAVAWEEKMGNFLQQPILHQHILQPRPFAPGQLVSERFDILKEIGEGAMGIVFEAFDRKRNQRIAIKSAKLGFAGFLTPELQGALKVRHPNVCLVNEIHTAHTEYGSVDFLTMELLEGETLATRLSTRGRYSYAETISIARQLCSGLAEAHRSDVIHRDLKPANIILCNGRAVITDFGLSGSDFKPGELCGTPAYMAPELWRGAKSSKASDIYALGVILHEMTTHGPPLDQNATAADWPRKEAISSFTALIEEFLNIDQERRLKAFQNAPGVLDSGEFSPHLTTPAAEARFINRRTAVLGLAAGSAAAAALWWKRPALENWLHPLPEKRFVAFSARLVKPDSPSYLAVTAVVDAFETELVRAEAADRNFLVISTQGIDARLTEADFLKTVHDALGANLVLETRGVAGKNAFQLTLRLVDASNGAVLRSKQISCPNDQAGSLTAMAVKAATAILNLPAASGTARLNPATGSAAALQAFRSAQELKKQPNEGGLDAAIAQYKRAVDSDPDYAIAHAELAMAYCRLFAMHGESSVLDLAQSNAERAIRLNDQLPEGHAALAFVFQNWGDEKNALAQIYRALALDPSNPRTLLWQADIYVRFGKWDDAERTYLQLRKLRPNYWLAYEELGVLLSQRGQYQKAIQAFQSAAVAAPQSSMAFNNLGMLLLKVGKISEAKQNIQKGLNLNPNDYGGYLNFGEALRAEGKYAAAVPFYKQAIQRDSADDQSLLALGDCYQAMRGKEEAARAAYSQAMTRAESSLQVDPSNGATMMRLALYRAKTGSAKESLALLRKAELLGANDIDSSLMKARVLAVLGMRPEAMAALAHCFDRGATRFEVQVMPDLKALAGAV
jgi:tetratricopeptide (TPR) repeat protein